eukprot:tig00021038_g17505.t1
MQELVRVVGRAVLLLVCLCLAVSRAAGQLPAPPGNPDSLAPGESSFCVGSQYDTTLPTPTSANGQGASARFTGIRSVHYNNYDGYLYVGVRNGIFRVDSTCTATLIVGSYAGVAADGAGVFGVDGMGTFATFGDVYALAAGPGNSLYVVDKGPAESAIRRVELIDLAVSTTLAYSPSDGRLYWALATSGGEPGNVTSCLPDGTDVRVAAILPPNVVPGAGSGLAAEDGSVPALFIAASSGSSGAVYRVDVGNPALWPVQAAPVATVPSPWIPQGVASFPSPGPYRLFVQARGDPAILSLDAAGALVAPETVAPPSTPSETYGISPIRNRPDAVVYTSWDQYRIHVHKLRISAAPTPSPSPAPGTAPLDLASVSPLAGASADGSVLLPVPLVSLGVSSSVASAPAGQYVFSWSQDAGAAVPPSAFSGASTPVFNVSGEALAPGSYTFTLTAFEPAAGRSRSFPFLLVVSIAPIPLRIPGGAAVTISLSVSVGVSVNVGLTAPAAPAAPASTPALRPGQTVPFDLTGLPDLSPYASVAPFVFRYTAGLYRASSNAYVTNVTVIAEALPRNGRAALVLPGAAYVPPTDELFYIRLELRGRDDVVSVPLARSHSRRAALQAPPAGFAAVIASGQSGPFRLLTFKGDSARAEQAGFCVTIFSAASAGIAVLTDAAVALAGAGAGPYGFGPAAAAAAGAGAAGLGAAPWSLGAASASAASAAASSALPRFGFGANLAVRSAQFTYFSAFYGGQRTAYRNMSASLEWANLYFRPTSAVPAPAPAPAPVRSPALPPLPHAPVPAAVPWGSSWATDRAPVRRSRAALELTEISAREGADSPSERFKESAFWSGVALAGAAVLQLAGLALWDWSRLAPRLPLVGPKVERKPVALRAPRLQVVVVNTAVQGFLVAAVATAYLRGNSTQAAIAASAAVGAVALLAMIAVTHVLFVQRAVVFERLPEPSFSERVQAVLDRWAAPPRAAPRAAPRTAHQKAAGPAAGAAGADALADRNTLFPSASRKPSQVVVHVVVDEDDPGPSPATPPESPRARRPALDEDEEDDVERYRTRSAEFEPAQRPPPKALEPYQPEPRDAGPRPRGPDCLERGWARVVAAWDWLSAVNVPPEERGGGGGEGGDGGRPPFFSRHTFYFAFSSLFADCRHGGLGFLFAFWDSILKKVFTALVVGVMTTEESGSALATAQTSAALAIIGFEQAWILLGRPLRERGSNLVLFLVNAADVAIIALLRRASLLAAEEPEASRLVDAAVAVNFAKSGFVLLVQLVASWATLAVRPAPLPAESAWPTLLEQALVSNAAALVRPRREPRAAALGAAAPAWDPYPIAGSKLKAAPPRPRAPAPVLPSSEDEVEPERRRAPSLAAREAQRRASVALSKTSAAGRPNAKPAPKPEPPRRASAPRPAPAAAPPAGSGGRAPWPAPALALGLPSTSEGPRAPPGLSEALAGRRAGAGPGQGPGAGEGRRWVRVVEDDYVSSFASRYFIV